MTTQNPPQSPTRWWQRAAQLTVIGGIIVAAAVTCGGHQGASADDATGQVQSACKDWVKDRLKSPSTADFTGVSTSSDGARYTVTGRVDSQNSFGAQVRTTWTCVATHAGDRSTLVSVDFQ